MLAAFCVFPISATPSANGPALQRTLITLISQSAPAANALGDARKKPPLAEDQIGDCRAWGCAPDRGNGSAVIEDVAGATGGRVVEALQGAAAGNKRSRSRETRVWFRPAPRLKHPAVSFLSAVAQSELEEPRPHDNALTVGGRLGHQGVVAMRVADGDKRSRPGDRMGTPAGACRKVGDCHSLIVVGLAELEKKPAEAPGCSAPR
jgi:hypothetical protein